MIQMTSFSVSTRTNPTGLKEIARKDVSICTRVIDGVRHFEVVGLDLTAYGLPAGLPVVVVATAGNTRVRTPIGTTDLWARGPHNLDGLDESQILRFRVLVRDSTSAILVASAENIRPVGDGDAESLIPIETAELGELLWRLRIEEDGATIQCNISVFPTGASAQNNIAFQAFVLPEALRQVVSMLAKDPEKLTGEGSAWRDWASWLTHLGFPEPPPEEGVEAWVDEVVNAFCKRHHLASEMCSAVNTSEGG